jgi:hypothetical protein
MRELSVRNIVRMWDTYLVRPVSHVFPSTEEHLWVIERRLERILRVSPIRLLCIPQALEEQVDGDGFPGTSPNSSFHLLVNLPLPSSIANVSEN